MAYSTTVLWWGGRHLESLLSAPQSHRQKLGRVTTLFVCKLELVCFQRQRCAPPRVFYSLSVKTYLFKPNLEGGTEAIVQVASAR